VNDSARFVNSVAGCSASANSAETSAFMSREKRILVLSETRGPRWQYHADHDPLPNIARGVHFQRLGAQVQAVLRKAVDSALKMVGR
jgi:hypothetical protein